MTVSGTIERGCPADTATRCYDGKRDSEIKSIISSPRASDNSIILLGSLIVSWIISIIGFLTRLASVRPVHREALMRRFEANFFCSCSPRSSRINSIFVSDRTWNTCNARRKSEFALTASQIESSIASEARSRHEFHQLRSPRATI